MAAFGTMSDAETRCRSQITAKTWVNAHAARNMSGQIICRFQRYMSPSSPGNGAWIETADDSVN